MKLENKIKPSILIYSITFLFRLGDVISVAQSGFSESHMKKYVCIDINLKEQCQATRLMRLMRGLMNYSRSSTEQNCFNKPTWSEQENCPAENVKTPKPLV